MEPAGEVTAGEPLGPDPGEPLVPAAAERLAAAADGADAAACEPCEPLLHAASRAAAATAAAAFLMLFMSPLLDMSPRPGQRGGRAARASCEVVARAARSPASHDRMGAPRASGYQPNVMVTLSSSPQYQSEPGCAPMITSLPLGGLTDPIVKVVFFTSTPSIHSCTWVAVLMHWM